MPPASTSSSMETSSSAAPSTSASSSTSSQNEAFVLLANGTKGAAAVGLVQQALQAPGVFVFGELLDHPNIKSLSSGPSPDGPAMLRLLEVFAYGTYGEYLQRRESDPTSLPELTPQMAKKLRLLTLASLAASSSRRLGYARLQSELGVDTVRELEDLVVEAANADVVRGKLDQRTLHLEVVYAMPRDIRRGDVKDVIRTLEDWCGSCDGMLQCLEAQATRANAAKAGGIEHKKQIEQKVRALRGQLKQSQSADGGEDPDSRMDTTDRGGGGSESSSSSSRRDGKKAAGGKGKGQRGGDRGKGGGGGGGGGVGFWQKS